MPDNPVYEITEHQNRSEDQKQYDEITDQFAEFTHNYIHDNIGRADNKATLIFSLVSGILLFLFNPDSLKEKNLFSLSNNDYNLFKIVIIVLISFMILSFFFSIIFAFATIFPRLKVMSYSHDDRTNLLYWECILKNKSSKEYTTSVTNITPNNLVKIKLEHCFEISLICSKKHKKLKLSMITAISGVIAFVIIHILVMIYSLNLLKMVY